MANVNIEKFKTFLRYFLRLLIGLTLIKLLCHKIFSERINWARIDINYFIFLFGMVLVILSFYFAVLKLHIAVSAYIKDFKETLRIFFIGWFFSNLLPTNMGGDLYQISFLKKRTKSFSKATALILVQRIIPIIILLIYSFIYLVLFPKKIVHFLLTDIEFKYINFNLIISVFIVSLLIILCFKRKIIILSIRIRDFVFNFLNSLKKISKNKYIGLVISSILFQFIRMTGLYLIILGFHQTLLIWDVYFILVLTSVLSILPISIGALGVQESVIVFGLSFLGVPIYIGAVIAFLYRGVFIIYALFGGFLFLLSKKEKRNEACYE